MMIYYTAPTAGPSFHSHGTFRRGFGHSSWSDGFLAFPLVALTAFFGLAVISTLVSMALKLFFVFAPFLAFVALGKMVLSAFSFGCCGARMRSAREGAGCTSTWTGRCPVRRGSSKCARRSRCNSSKPRNVDAEDNEKDIKFSMDVPGVKASDIDIAFNKATRTLDIRGERTTTTPATLCFSKTVVLDESMDADNITAVLEYGVLTVTVPKDETYEERNVRKIPICCSSTKQEAETEEDASAPQAGCVDVCTGDAVVAESQEKKEGDEFVDVTDFPEED